MTIHSTHSTVFEVNTEVRRGDGLYPILFHIASEALVGLKEIKKPDLGVDR